MTTNYNYFYTVDHYKEDYESLKEKSEKKLWNVTDSYIGVSIPHTHTHWNGIKRNGNQTRVPSLSNGLVLLSANVCKNSCISKDSSLRRRGNGTAADLGGCCPW